MKLAKTETRVAVVKALTGAEAPMTLAEVAEAMGVEKVATGTTNAMVTAGVLRKAGTRKVAKVTYVEVATYELGENAEAFLADKAE